MTNCEKCGTEIPENTTLCENCSAQNEPVSADQQPGAIPEEQTKQPLEKKKSKKGIILAAVSLLLVAAIIAGIFLFGNKNKSSLNYTVYIKEGALYYTELNEIAPVKVAEKAVEDVEALKESSLAGLIAAARTALLEDKETLVYPKNVSLGENSDLFYMNIKAEDAQETKIDSEIGTYEISVDGKILTYTKGGDAGSFGVYRYLFETKAKEKIVENASYVDISENGTKILYLSDDSSLYIYDFEKEGDKKEKIDSNVESVSCSNDDFSKLYYLKEEALYEKSAGNEKKKIASDVSKVIKVYETGEAYYLSLESEEIPYSDLFTDDMYEKDKDVIEADAAYAKMKWADFKTWYTKNYAACERNGIREIMKEQHIDKDIYSLHYVNGDEHKEIAENISADQFNFTYTCASDAPVLVFNTINKETMSKFKLSELETGTIKYNESEFEWERSIKPVECYTKLREAVELNYLDAQKLQVAIGGTVTDIEEDRALDITVAKDGSAIYYIDNIEVEKTENNENRDYDAEWSRDVYYFGDDDELRLNHDLWGDDFDTSFEGEAFKITVTEGAAGKAEPVDSDVCLYGIRLEDDGESLTYFKNYDTEKKVGDYYTNGKEIAYDVKATTVNFVSDNEVYYLSEYDEDSLTGILKYYNGEENSVIASDVHYFEITSAGSILFLSDYSEKNNYGSLYLAGKDENILVDYDVTTFICSDE